MSTFDMTFKRQRARKKLESPFKSLIFIKNDYRTADSLTMCSTTTTHYSTV